MAEEIQCSQRTVSLSYSKKKKNFKINFSAVEDLLNNIYYCQIQVDDLQNLRKSMKIGSPVNWFPASLLSP